MSSDDEDEFDKMINKKLNQIKKKNNQTTNYFFYLVSRKSIIDIFRKSRDKQIKIIIFIIILIFLCFGFGLSSMVDMSKIFERVIGYTNFMFDTRLLLS